MRISEAQRLIREMYFQRDRARGLFGTYLWFIEEVGELAEAMREGEGMEEEFADVLAWLLSLANLVGVDVEGAFLSKYYDKAPGRS